MEYNLIGNVFKNNKGYEYEVLSKVVNGKYKIKFIQSGYTRVSDKKEILNGNIKDWESPSVCGIGIVGTEFEHPQKHYLYDRWRDMLRRCYDKTSNNYHTYGALGVKVDERWHRFSNYVTDIETKENHEKLKVKNSGWEIDKDILSDGLQIYSNETTLIIRSEDNIKERNDRMGNPSENSRKRVMQFTTNGEYIKTYNSLIEVCYEYGNNINSSWLINCCKGKGKTAFNYCWMYESDFINFEDAKNKILNRMNKVSTKKLKTILKMDDNYNVIEEFIGINEAAQKLNRTVGSISNAITRKNKCNGFFLKYKEEI